MLHFLGNLVLFHQEQFMGQLDDRMAQDLALLNFSVSARRITG
jgi:hypothetical protein